MQISRVPGEDVQEDVLEVMMKANSFSKARLDRNEIERRLRLELEGLDIDKIASEVRKEVNEWLKRDTLRPQSLPTQSNQFLFSKLYN